MWLQAKRRAEELQSIVLWCDGGEGGVSGVAGSGFNDVVQVGSGSFVRTIGIQYPFDHQKTSFARWGNPFLILILFWCLVFIRSPSYLFTKPVGYIRARMGKFLQKRMNHRGQNAPVNLLD